MLPIRIFFKTFKLACLTVCLGIAVHSSSQEIKYDDIFAKLPTLKPANAYHQFFSFQQQNPYFSNTYIQLGRICELKLMEIDPLRDFEQANYWANNAVLFYNLFPVYLKEGDVRRNREYYANLITPPEGKKIEHEDALAFLNARLNFCKGYKDTVALLYSALAKSKDHYNNCVQIFKSVNNSYSNYNIALLRTDNDFISLLDSLDREFKASVDSFNVYQNLINKYPIANYNQKFTLKPIETFRLDGITNSDFLDNSLIVWDYGMWVKRYNDIYKIDIGPLRKEIIDINELFKANKRKLSLIDTLSHDEKFKSFDDLFLFRLGKYDNNSIVRELFDYLESNQELNVSSKSTLNNPNDSSSALTNRKFRYYHRLALEHKKASDKLELLKSGIDEEKVLNHKDFFNKYYKGLKGLANFCNDENQSMKSLMNDNFDRLRRYLQNERALKMSLGYSRGRQKIPLIPNYALLTDATSEPFIVYSVSYKQENPNFIGGYMNRLGRKPSAFVAKVDNTKNVEWLKEVSISPSLLQGDCARYIFGFENGCVALVSGKDGETNKNNLIRLDAKGGVVFKKLLDETTSPCFLQYDEITQNTLLGFGVPVPGSNSILGSISVFLTDSVGNIQWKSVIPSKGILVDIAKTSDRHIAFVNYQNYQDGTRTMNAGADPEVWGHLMAIINASNGNVEKIIPIKSASSFTISKVFSFSNSEICLIGQTTPSAINSESQIRFVIVSGKGDVIYSNL